MKNTKKALLPLAALIGALLLMVGCTFKTSIGYTFSVDTGDQIKVTLDTTDKYSMTSEVPFTISHHGDACMQGRFIPVNLFEQYVLAVKNDAKATILDSGSRDGIQYLFWNYNNEEYNFVISVDNSNTGLLLSDTVSEESARECFERLSFTLVKD